MAADSALGGAAQGAAAGASFGPWGAAIGGAVGLVSGILGSKSAKKEAARQQALMDQQVAEQRRQQARYEQGARDRAALAQAQIADAQKTAENIQQQRQAALAAGNATLAANLTTQLNEIDQSLEAQTTQINATEAALETARTTGNLESLKAVEDVSKEQISAQEKAAKMEEQALLPAQAANEAVRKQGLADVQQGNATLRAEMNRVAGQDRPEGLAAVQSDIENKAASAEAEARRQAGASGQALSGGVKLNIALSKLKASAGAAAQMYQNWSNQRIGNLSLLAGGLGQGAQAAQALRDKTGETAAERARFYGGQQQATLGQAGAAKINLAAKSAEERSRILEAGGTARLAAVTGSNAARIGAIGSEGAARFGLQTGTADAMVGDTANAAAAKRSIEESNAAAQQNYLSGQAAAASGISAAYGASSQQAGQNAAAGYAASAAAVGKGLEGLAAGVGKYLDNKKKTPGVDPVGEFGG